jgi:hypothetical protein
MRFGWAFLSLWDAIEEIDKIRNSKPDKLISRVGIFIIE